jgi:hypothetical protein
MVPTPDKQPTSDKPVNAWFADELEQWSRDVRKFFSQFRRDLADVLASSRVADNSHRRPASGEPRSKLSGTSGASAAPLAAATETSDAWSEDRFAQLKRQLSERADRAADSRNDEADRADRADRADHADGADHADPFRAGERSAAPGSHHRGPAP